MFVIATQSGASAIAAIAWGWIGKILAYSLPSAGIVFTLFKWAGNTWAGRLLNRDLEKFKREQQEQLAAFQTKQQRELELFRHLLSSRVSRIHEKEFEVLPKAWLMLNELRGAVAHAVDMTKKYYPDFQTYSDAKLETFLREEAVAQGLKDYQIDELKKIGSPGGKQKYYMDAIMSRNIDEAEKTRRDFANFLIENRIFMNDELRNKFDEVQKTLTSALINYSVGKSSENWDLVHSGQTAMIDTKMQELFDEVDRAIQKRLRYAEAG